MAYLNIRSAELELVNSCGWRGTNSDGVAPGSLSDGFPTGSGLWCCLSPTLTPPAWPGGSWCWDRASSSRVPNPWGLHGLGTPLAIAQPHAAWCRWTHSTMPQASSWWEMQINNPTCYLSLSVSRPGPLLLGFQTLETGKWTIPGSPYPHP